MSTNYYNPYGIDRNAMLKKEKLETEVQEKFMTELIQELKRIGNLLESIDKKIK
ncbi:hypothetical protein SAMN02745975_03722 [Geosporobacter subterraneus DSM 17957]|uniref:Uncharacterized protein n=1 Tax=Geosporobacter subterraneus DSM 17957 TaxID=1121919 RepID=A0A1M6PYP0_9FIRM|nr:hypothetical protein [Geosporobacter subterraneus]SHK13073.1 hypothetical protein SAMN02745975_03722 [Geosporobacter subterraneus DSM 17957]